MFSKIAILTCVLAVANAGYLGTAPVATYATVPSYTTNYAAPAVASYAAPSYTTSYAAPSYTTSYAAPAYAGEATLSATSENTYRSAGNLHTVSTQSRSIATPYSSSNKHFTKYTNPAVYAQATTYTGAAPVAYAAAAPVAHAPVAYSAAAPTVPHGSGLLGVAYSPAVAVSHMTYNSPSIGYAW